MTADPLFRRHPVLCLLGINVLAFCLLAGIGEIALRILVPYDPGFYMEARRQPGVVEYPYGTIPINSEGFPDAEFDLSRTRRVGYMGDSVTYGVGAGYPHRVSELLERIYPEFEHMNFGGIGLSLSAKDIDRNARLAERFQLEKTIYLVNLNDIVPDAVAAGEAQTVASRSLSFLRRHVDGLRGNSYLYTWLRTKSKTALEGFGVGFHGYTAFELTPRAHESAFRETAERINALSRRLAPLNTQLVIVLLPYEMQISEEAALRYRALGIRWEEGFLERSAQQLLLRYLDPEIPTYDAYFAFVDPSDRRASRANNALGQFFVYDKGDKLDWNHPNRRGHAAIASYLSERGILSASAPAGR